MTQGRDGISMAPKTAPWLMGVARRLSVVAAMFVIAALAATAGTSYAQGAKAEVKRHPAVVTADTVTVTNFGSAFGGTLATFKAGSGPKAGPFLFVKGANTLLNSGTGPAGVAVGAFGDDHIAVSVPIDLIDLTGFGAFPAALACTGPGQAVVNNKPVAIGCCTAFHKGDCEPGTGFAEIFSAGATGNAVAENVIGTRNVTFDNVGAGCTGLQMPLPCCTGPNAGTCAFNTSGVNTPQGVAFEDPFDDVNPGKNIVAITNTLPINFFSTTDLVDASNGGAACAAFGGFTVGTITEFDRGALATGFNDNVPPFNNNPVCTLPAAAIPPLFSSPPTTCPIGSRYNATIGGCDTFLLGPVAAAFDESGYLFVVNEAAVPMKGPGFVSVYFPGAFGDSFPAALIGLTGTNTPIGTFKDPAKIAVSSDFNFFDDVIFVTDVGDNSIKIFEPFQNFDGLFFEGMQIGTIKGGNTKLKRPEGIAVSAASGNLYVVNNLTNSFEMYTDIGAVEDGGGDIAPTLIVEGNHTKLNFPVDIALPNFTPSAVPTEAGSQAN
jgi:hypothetical protein